ncbi:MAG: hypothetical protein JNL74_17855 [Fibrobacteres bacterium]|nr:hypothetical protein [Fibrobacterota bacterium]
MRYTKPELFKVPLYTKQTASSPCKSGLDAGSGMWGAGVACDLGPAEEDKCLVAQQS